MIVMQPRIFKHDISPASLKWLTDSRRNFSNAAKKAHEKGELVDALVFEARATQTACALVRLSQAAGDFPSAEMWQEKATKHIEQLRKLKLAIRDELEYEDDFEDEEPE